MSKRSVLLISILIILGVGGVIGYKMWNKPFKDPLQGDAIKVTAMLYSMILALMKRQHKKNMFLKN